MKFIVILFTLCAALLSHIGHAQEQFSPTQQQQIMAEAAQLIDQRYVDAEAAQQIEQRIQQDLQRWSTPLTGQAFAKQATDYLRNISADGHLGLSYSETPIKENTGEDFSAAQMEKWYGAHRNHGIEKIERFDDNIMLLDVRVFPPLEMAADVFSAAMTVVAQADGLIIDLRKNGGGAETKDLMLGYLLPAKSPLSGTYNRPTDTHTYNVSPVYVPGRRYGADKPLVVLTSKRTFSAAEALAYELQALGRATIIGEVTGGGAHPFEYRKIHPHFAVDLPEGKSIHPITESNWQGVGVQPDIRVAADQALATALEYLRASDHQ